MDAIVTKLTTEAPRPTREEAEQAVRTLLLWAGDDPEREGLLDTPARVAKAQEAQRIFRDDFMFIPWYKQTMSRWATAAVSGMEKNLDWQVFAPWNVSIA